MKLPSSLLAIRLLATLLASCYLFSGSLKAQTPDDYLKWVQAEAARMRMMDPYFHGRATLEVREAARRRDLARAWGGMEPLATPIDPQITGALDRQDYRIEKVHFQTFPGVRMPALLYLPRKEGKHPAVLHVHGHWKGAKQDPTVQARCVAQVRAGFVVLCVDAFGAGERAIGTALGEYHGEMTGATLLPLGKPLSGIQVLENMRAVDYLISRPEVDGTRLGITGASGGGNQTMYAGSWDKRFGAVVPVCSVGNYQAYLGAACCMCEVVPGALQFTEEDAILALTAPRALMVISASRDAKQFSPGEAAKSIKNARAHYLPDQSKDRLIHKVFESGHDYSKPMRESMIGFMRKHLMGVGNGAPFPEADFTPEPPESLRLFPGDTRPRDFVTLPQFAGREARAILAAQKLPTDAASWDSWRKEKRDSLRGLLYGSQPITQPQEKPLVERLIGGKALRFSPETGITLEAHVTQGLPTQPRVIVLHEDGLAGASSHPIAKALKDAQISMISMDLRALGRLAVKGDRIGAAPDHNSAEWALWLGRPLVGQWSLDVQRLLDKIDQLFPPRDKEQKTLIVGLGTMGLTALVTAAQDVRIDGVLISDSLQSWVTDAPYKNQRLGNMIPGVLKEVGDVASLMALVAPRKLIIINPVDAQGTKVTPEKLTKSLTSIRSAWPKPENLITGATDTVNALSQLWEMPK